MRSLLRDTPAPASRVGHWLAFGAVVALTCGVAACNEEAKPTADTKPGAPAAATTAAAATAEVKPDEASAEEIPTEADFEDEAETTITASNLESQLDALEKEIGE